MFDILLWVCLIITFSPELTFNNLTLGQLAGWFNCHPMWFFLTLGYIMFSLIMGLKNSLK